MPKLDSKTAEFVKTAEPLSTEFEPLQPGKYLAKLGNVEIRDTKNKYDLAMWNAEFIELHTLDGEKVPGRQWLNLTAPGGSKPPAAYQNGQEKWLMYQTMLAGRMAAFFNAFGYSEDSDTDEMIGEWAVITVGIETIQAGPKQGQLTNRVTDIAPVPATAALPDAGADEETF